MGHRKDDGESPVTTSTPPGAAPTGRRSRAAFWNYWAASATSTLGMGVTAVALPLVALTELGATNFEVGVLTAAGYAAVVLIGLPAGVIVQRYELRSLQVGMDLFRAAAILSIPVAFWWGALSLPQLLIVAFAVGLASNLFDVANATFLPQVVPPEELISRNGLLSGTLATAHLGGPAVGGVLVQAVGAATSLVADAVTYLVSAVFLARIPPPGRRPARPGAQPSLFRQVSEGLGYVFRHPVMRPSVIAASAANFANGAILATVAPFVVRTLDLSAAAVGLVLAVDGLGTVVGAAVTARLARAIGGARALLLATTVGAVAAFAMPLAVTGWAVLIFAFGIGGFAAGVCVLSVVTRTHRQIASPPDLLSRVMASVRFVSWSAIPLGSLCAGTAAELVGPRAGLVVACVGAVAMAGALWCSDVRRLREMTDTPPPTGQARSA